MKSIFFMATALFSMNNFAAIKWNSVYTDLSKDCVTISSATDKAPIDFFNSECKSFGGFSLFIEGGDLRYGPLLKYNGVEIDLKRPGAFHDTGSTKVEWVYTLEQDAEGLGQLNWKGLIYRLNVASFEEEGKNDSILYSVRLDGEKSCLIGTSKTNEAALNLVKNSKVNCK